MIKRVMIVVSLLFLLAACSTEATPVTYEEACNIEYNDERIEVEGYLTLGNSVYCSGTSGDYRCGLKLVQSLDDDPSDGISADVVEGNGPNTMSEIPDSYDDDDLQLTTADRETATRNDRLRVSGDMLITEDVCLMEVERIEQVDSP